MLMRMEAAASVATSHRRCGGRYGAATRWREVEDGAGVRGAALGRKLGNGVD